MNDKQKLQELKERNQEIYPIVFKSFKTEKEQNDYRNNNLLLFEEYTNNLNEIERLEWKLMSPQEREELLEYRKMLKEKYSED